MADLAPAVGGLLRFVGPLLGSLIKSALGTFVWTGVGMGSMGLLALGLSWAVAGQSVWWHGPVAGLVSLLLFAGLGLLLATKRAVAAALIRALREVALGSKATRALFTKLLGVDESGVIGDRGVDPARRVERVPLAQAEARLTAAVQALTQANEDGRGIRAWLRRKIEATLIERIEQITLANFRDAHAQAGGVDLLYVRDDLGQKIDGLLIAQVQGAVQRLSVLLVLAASVGSLLVAVGLRQIP